MNPFKWVWDKITKKSQPVATVSVVFLGMPLSRPFSWASETDAGQRPCFRVTGLTLDEAKEKFIGKSIDWGTVDFSYLKELELGGGIVDVSDEDLQRMMK